MNDEISRTSVLCEIDLKLSRDVYTNLLYINLCNVNVLTEWFVVPYIRLYSRSLCDSVKSRNLSFERYDDFI